MINLVMFTETVQEDGVDTFLWGSLLTLISDSMSKV